MEVLEPSYRVEKKEGNFEVGAYQAMLLAEVQIPGRYWKGFKIGFAKLMN